MGAKNAERASSLSYCLDRIQALVVAQITLCPRKMTNYIEPAKELLHAKDYKTLNVLGVLWNVTKGLQRLHTIFGSFGLLSLPTEQLIRQVNMLMQHYHASTNLGRKLDASLRYLQLQLGTPHNPLTLDYAKWGQLALLSGVKML